MLYPINTKSRMINELSGMWNFKLDNGKGFEEKWYEKPLTEVTTMPVPASYNDIKEGVDFRDHYGWVFYQKDLVLPRQILSERIVLRCDAVTHVAKVYLDGVLIKEHKGGFLPFEVDITDKVKEDGNLLTIAVDNKIDNTTLPVGGKEDMFAALIGGAGIEMPEKNNPNFDFFNYCGITRPVRIYTTPKNYIADVSLVPEIDGKNGIIKYEVETVGAGDVKVEVYDEDKNLVASADGGSGEIVVKDAKLWQPLNAYLYDVKVIFADDEYILPFGIRTVEVKGTKFLINGKPFYFKGYGRHEDTYPNGRGLNIAMNAKDMSLMKWQNANSFRTSHYPYSEEMMRYCDREGMVVIDETTAVGVNSIFGGGAAFGVAKKSTFDKETGVKTFEHHKEVIRDLIDRDKNYACVVMWSIANEPDSFSEGAYEYFEPLYKLAREYDPQKRPRTLVSVQMGKPNEDVSGKLSDVICLNRYYGWYFGSGELDFSEGLLRKELQFWAMLKKPVMFTEYGADTVAGMHEATPVMFTEEYQVDYYKMNSKVFDEFDFVIGEQVWNFADFATSQGIMRVQGNKKGIFTRDRKPKMVAHYLRDRWGGIPDFDYK